MEETFGRAKEGLRALARKPPLVAHIVADGLDIAAYLVAIGSRGPQLLHPGPLPVAIGARIGGAADAAMSRSARTRCPAMADL